MINTPEIWGRIVGAEDRYEISTNGVIKSIARHDLFGTGRFRPARICKLQKTVDGYLTFHVSYSNMTKKLEKVHRLVALTFIPNPENKPFINHKNGIKDDNRVENLEWCTPSENTKHSFSELGRINPQKGNYGKLHNCYGKGVLLHNAKRVKCDTLDVEFNSANEAARLLGVGQGHLSSVCRGERKHTQGLVFRYLN